MKSLKVNSRAHACKVTMLVMTETISCAHACRGVHAAAPANGAAEIQSRDSKSFEAGTTSTMAPGWLHNGNVTRHVIAQSPSTANDSAPQCVTPVQCPAARYPQMEEFTIFGTIFRIPDRTISSRF